ncbi:MAG: WYL domain-containing protein [Clostridiales bacterium]|jgi:predicted DNA-binding transcriptional regulator YafY|nr:WYL domain-containing protein [Clostridiales bacterium]
MAKSHKQKLKLLYLQKILLENTDEAHPMTISDMITALSRFGISAERKTIYDDLNALSVFGLDIVYVKSKTNTYYVGSKTFELPELKLLCDAVASAKFISEKKSGMLIKKIESLASVHEAKQLRRQVYVRGRVKTANEQIYYNVDTIHQAIAQGRQISFLYFDYNLKKEKQYRQDGAKYKASPYALSWDDENYYMTAYYEKYGSLSNFRVDKMENIDILEEKAAAPDDNLDFDPADYAKKVFGMYSGVEERITLQFDNSLIGVVLDRFGKNVTIFKKDENSFVINVSVNISPMFLGWLFGFGGKVRILSPESLIKTFGNAAAEITERYLT